MNQHRLFNARTHYKVTGLPGYTAPESANIVENFQRGIRDNTPMIDPADIKDVLVKPLLGQNPEYDHDNFIQ